MFSSGTSGKDVASLVTSEFSNSVAKTNYLLIKAVMFSMLLLIIWNYSKAVIEIFQAILFIN